MGVECKGSLTARLDDAIEKLATCTQLHGQVDVLPVLPDRHNTTSARPGNVRVTALLAFSKLGLKTKLYSTEI